MTAKSINTITCFDRNKTYDSCIIARVPANEDRNLTWWKLEHISKVTYCQKYQVMIACLNNVHKETIKECECYVFLACYVHDFLFFGWILCLLHILKNGKKYRWYETMGLCFEKKTCTR